MTPTLRQRLHEACPDSNCEYRCGPCKHNDLVGRVPEHRHACSSLHDIIASIRATTDFDIERFIAGLWWSPEATKYLQEIVAGNLRNLYNILRQDFIPGVPERSTSFGVDSGRQCDDEECEHQGTRHSHQNAPEPHGVTRSDLDAIANEHPISGDHAEDGRYNYPKRWDAVVRLVETKRNNAPEPLPNELMTLADRLKAAHAGEWGWLDVALLVHEDRKALEEKLHEETERANENFTAYERVKAAFSQARRETAEECIDYLEAIRDCFNMVKLGDVVEQIRTRFGIETPSDGR
jgi:hypothetical protein